MDSVDVVERAARCQTGDQTHDQVAFGFALLFGFVGAGFGEQAGQHA
ncbi:hypothetical protein TRP66_07670 [Pseudomonas sp. JDS28PS106]